MFFYTETLPGFYLFVRQRTNKGQYVKSRKAPLEFSHQIRGLACRSWEWIRRKVDKCAKANVSDRRRIMQCQFSGKFLSESERASPVKETDIAPVIKGIGRLGFITSCFDASKLNNNQENEQGIHINPNNI